MEGIFDDLDEGKLEDRESWLSMVMKKGAAFFLQQLLEEEVTDLPDGPLSKSQRRRK